jgi:hypothetical protein
LLEQPALLGIELLVSGVDDTLEPVTLHLGQLGAKHKAA